MLSAREQTLVEALSEAMIQCPDRVWPGGSWQTFQVMFVDRDAQRAVLWNDLSQGYGSEPRITLVPYDDLTTDFLFGYYNFTTWNTEMTLSISLDLTGIWAGTDLALSLAFHEGFHYFNQRTWTGGGGQRDDDYPIDWQPRYLRFRLISALRDSLVNPTDLGAAAYWRQQWITGYAAEVAQIRGTDRIEGSANYAEMIALRIAEHGCSITETALDNEIRNGIDTMIMASLDKSGESYDLGVAAGALMRANQITD